MISFRIIYYLILFSFLSCSSPEVEDTGPVIQSPHLHTTWHKKSTESVTWDESKISGKVTLKLLWDNSLVAYIGEDLRNDGSHFYWVPGDIEESDNYRISLCDEKGDYYSDPFTIEPLPPPPE